jgi:diketogulonate reductase-like aldo/keto reductase
MTAFTKWCPQENGIKTFENAKMLLILHRVDLARSRSLFYNVSFLEQMRPILIEKLMKRQDHAWGYSDDTYFQNLTHLSRIQKQGKIAHIGLTNTDTVHLKMLLDSGFSIATNQVPCSIIDRRIARSGGLG